MAEHSPTPWRVADIDHDYDIIDADGKVAARAAHGDRALAGYIADAVNLYSQIEAARTDSDGNRHLLQMEGKPVVIITPPPSEAEVVRTFRDLYNNVNQDRMMLMRGRMDALNECDRLGDELDKVRAALERANRYGMQADEENAKLRDLVRRMIPHVNDLKWRTWLSDFVKCIDCDTDPKILEMNALIDEASEALGEHEP